MGLFRRKLWGDRTTWIFVVVASVFVVNQYITRGGDIRLYILLGWAAIVGWLIFFSELRLGRREPKLAAEALFAGWAAFVGEERLNPDGQRDRGWTGTAPGVLALEPNGMRWVPRGPSEGPIPMLFPWPEVFSWRLVGVIPFVWRASGYVLITLYGGREYVFHVHGILRWRQALREAMIVLPAKAPAMAGVAASTAASAPVATVEGSGGLATVGGSGGQSERSERPPDAITYEPVIGIECHVELSTASKMFCRCPTTFGADPNTSVCEVCTGQPGTLPVPNREAIEGALRISVALGCTVTPESIFHRKNYFYPDMPKNYQISQYDIPLATGGSLEFDVDGAPKRVGIERVHIEEDTGKTIHGGEGGRIGDAEHAMIDYNRAGIPLVEIVTQPDIHTPEEARAYVAELRALLLTLGVSDVRMEEGSMRCDANVSVRPTGTSELGTKTEVKNMNSLRSLQRALAFEIERQVEAVEKGQTIVQETRHFDESAGRTIGGRAKEGSSDYRYFPDPDLVPLAPSPAWVEEIRSTLPELPTVTRQRLTQQLGLSPADARTLTASPVLADAFRQAVDAYGGGAQPIARWYLGELAQLANERNAEPQSLVSPDNIAELQKLIDSKKISDSMAKGEILKEMVASGRAPSVIVAESGVEQISDESQLATLVDNVIASNADVVEQIRGGKTGAINALVGHVMRDSKGQADPGAVGRIIKERLGV